MINGEGTRDTSSEVVSPDPSPASWQYSSCGESEFERYCSANSVVGTPSMGSSSFRAFNDCIDSEFGSLRSFGIGDDGSLENFSLEGGLDRNSETQKRSSTSGGSGSFGDRRIQYWEGKINTEHRNDMDAGKGLVMVKNGSNFYDNMEDYSMLEGRNAVGSDFNMSGFLTVLDEGLCCNDDQDGIILNRRHSETEVVLSSAEDLPSQESFCVENGSGNMCDSGIRNSFDCLVGDEEGSQPHMVTEEDGVCLNGLNSGSDLQFDGRETIRPLDEEESLSRNEHSEDEDSMFDYGTDNEHMSDLHSKQNIHYSRKEKFEGVNSLLMSSSVAFGSEDWDDFEQEIVSSNLPSVMSNKYEVRKQLNNEFEWNLQKFSPAIPIEFPGVGGSMQGEDVNKISVANGGVQVADESADYLESCSVTPRGCIDLGGPEQGEEVGNIPLASNPVQATNESAEYQSCSVSNVYQTQLDSQVQMDPLSIGLNVMGGGIETEHQHRISEEVIGVDDNQVLESQELEESKYRLDPLSDTTDIEETFFKEKKSTFSADLCEDYSASIKTENLTSNRSYNDVVNEMEEILLHSFESSGVGFFQDNQIYQSHSHLTLPSRDDGSTASTCGTNEVFSLVQRPLRIDGIEVVGAKQKEGDVSLGERLVGVKEYTVYIIRVWSGKFQWEVERRYRDFFTLFQRLKLVFTDQGLSLPSPWSSVERESRKIFGIASPDVVSERSSLIEECLRSILHSRISSSSPTALILFLSPQDAFPSSPASKSWSTFFTRGADTENISTLGKTISLMVEIRPYKSMRQLLEAQNYTCAGCHINFDDGKTLMRDFVHSLGWGKPRLCEYTGQLFCSSCHTNETAILPARVLHHWDFTQYPVSQLAKSYLGSIHDQPMLCVSAVNPFLFSKVPAMLHNMNVRKKVGAVLPYVRCPFRRSINKALGSRRYLLESNDFFALRDLIDLSKGAFAALPVMIESVSRKILEHITEQCLICCDVGVPCGARQDCNDPSSLIFPFQEGEIEKCKSCRLVFHWLCFRNITICPCGLELRTDEATKRASSKDDEEEGALNLMVRKLGSGLPVGFLSGILSKSRQENQRGHKDGDTVILMGSLPSTSL